jgi:hypothetical protein
MTIGKWDCFRYQVRGDTHTLLDPLERASPMLTLALSKGPNRVVSIPSPSCEKVIIVPNIVVHIC